MQLATPDAVEIDPSEKDDPELTELVDRFSPRVARAASRFLMRWGLPESARDDLVSAGFLGLLKALQNRRPDAHEFELSAYVSRRIDGAVVDEARGFLGRAVRTSPVDPVLLDGGVPVDEGGGNVLGQSRLDDPEAWMARTGRWARVERCLDEVDGEVRSILIGIAAGASVAEIARNEGRSAGQVQARLTRGIRQLRGRAPELRRLLREEL